MNQLNDLEREELEYYRKKEELHKYAKEFQLKLAKDGFIDLVHMDLNIQLVNGFNCYNSGIFKACQASGFLGDKTNPVIKVYGVDYLGTTNIKKTLRHEMLHFVLWLYNLPHGDNSPVFHAMARIYKAGAYERVPEEQKDYCNELKQLSKEDLFRKLLDGYIDCFDENDKLVNYYDYWEEKRKGISRIHTNWDCQKVKREVI